MKSGVFLLFLLATTSIVRSQDSRVILKGRIVQDSLYVSDITIVNLNTTHGTISDSNGYFEIEVQKNDTLEISGIQYKKKQVFINNNHIEGSGLVVNMELQLNELDEVLLQKKISDSIDIAKMTKTINKGFQLSLKDLNVEMTVDADSRRNTSSDSQIQSTNGNLIGLAVYLLTPVVRLVGSIGEGKRKDKRRLKKLKADFQKKVSKAPSKIRKSFGDDFFIDIGIPSSHIDQFIEFCESKKIGEYFVKGNTLKIIDVFLEESEEFRKLYGL